MREALFVKQNSAKWQKFENLQTASPDELANYFIEITDDLAYSKTFFPNSKTTLYLNGLASRFHQSIYRNKRESSSRFINFWKLELPALFKKNDRKLLYSLIFFLVACLIGAVSARYDHRFLNLILGDSYVAMTNENIAKGDPFAVYKKDGELQMFIRIAVNNIRVAFLAFVSGILFSVGTVFILIKNGIMVGSFEYFFFSKGLGIESILVIWIHGTLEIAAIIIAGGAGLVLGNSLLFPGTFHRLDSVKRGAKEGLKICLGAAPIFFLAAILEGYVTRHTSMPLWLSCSILGSSLTFIIWYVIIYPRLLISKTNPSYGTEN